MPYQDVSFLSRLPEVASVALEGDRVCVEGTGTAAVTVAAAPAAHGLVPDDYRTHRPSLEDVFLALTGRSLDEGAPR